MDNYESTMKAHRVHCTVGRERRPSFGECVCGRARAEHSAQALQAAASKPSGVRKARSESRGVQGKLAALAAKEVWRSHHGSHREALEKPQTP